MPCDSGYLEPTKWEREIHRAAKLLVYAFNSMNLSISDETYNIADRECYYPSKNQGDKIVAQLCSFMRKLEKGDSFDRIVNAKTKIARDLANWWEDHQEADKTRISGEKEKRRQEKVKKTALAKLTDEEKVILGLE